MKFTYFVHSITTDNESGIATGWLPGELSTEGVKRAMALSTDLQSRSFDFVFCSDLKRAQDTAHLYFGEVFPLFTDWRLRECNYGDLNGRPASEFKENREEDYINSPYPGGESYIDVENRMRSFVTDMLRLFAGKHIAIVSHQAPQLALDVILAGHTWEHAIENDWRNTGTWQSGWLYQIDDLS